MTQTLNLSEKMMIRINAGLLITALATLGGGIFFLNSLINRMDLIDQRLQMLDVRSAEQTVQMERVNSQLNSSNRAQAIIETLVGTQGRRIEALESELKSMRNR